LHVVEEDLDGNNPLGRVEVVRVFLVDVLSIPGQALEGYLSEGL